MGGLAFSRYGTLLPRDEPYQLTLVEIQRQFGLRNHTRRNIFDGLSRAVDNLFTAGVTRIALGGSFVSLKPNPRDADVAWWYNPDLDWSKLDAVFKVPERRPARAKYLVDQRVDGVRDVPYELSHEFFLRKNLRMPEKFQDVGIVVIKN